MSQQLLPTVSFQEGMRRLGGFFAGLLIVLPLGWGLIALAYYVLAPMVGVTPLTAGLIAAAVSFVAIQLLERNHRLTKLMGFEVPSGVPAWMTATVIWLLGPLWLFYQVGNYGHETWLTKLTQFSQPLQPQKKKEKEKAKDSHRDHIRESVETLVFVITLVLMLKTFVVEAFVIPTGSMAETLYGYKKEVTCPECGHEFAVNASREAEPQPGTPPTPITGYCCPNCRFTDPEGLLQKDPVSGKLLVDANTNRPVPKDRHTSGDRLLVSKFMGIDDRHRVVVFKFPDAPQTGQISQNYIKRLVGLGGETVAIYNGDLYVTRSVNYDPNEKDEQGYPKYPRPERAEDLWRTPYTDNYYNQRWKGQDYRYANSDAAVTMFKAGQNSGFADPNGFQIVRKPDDVVLEMRRLVYDNDHQAKSLVKSGAAPRWFPGSEAAGWAMDDTKAPKTFTHTGEQIGWVRYNHLLPTGGVGWTAASGPQNAQKITNFLGYNAGFEAGVQGNLVGSDDWCGDLLLECEAKIDDPSAKFVLELSKGPNRFQAEFAGGKVKLVRTGPGGGELATRDTPITKAGSYSVRFANVDCRLRVWVNGTAIDFGTAADYAPPPPPLESNKEPWTDANDVKEPASIGASGGVRVSGLKLWRDTHYTNIKHPLDTFYVQPGHYLCMGDNSSQSSDGRMWGLVPERLMLGRAVFVFYPLNRIGFIK